MRGLERINRVCGATTLTPRLAGKFLNGFDPSPTRGWDKCPKGWTLFEPLVKVCVRPHCGRWARSTRTA